MYHSLLIHSLSEGHLGYFQVLTIMNKTAKNIHVKVFFYDVSFHLLWELDHMVRVYLVL